METFITAHPVLFTILALPVVVTVCLIVLMMAVSLFGFELRWRQR